MRVVRPVGGDFNGEIRIGKRVIVAEKIGDKWQADVDDGDELVEFMNAGFVKPDSPMAKPAPKRVAPKPAVDVVVVEKKAAPKAAPKKAPKAEPKKKSAPKKSAPKKSK